MDWHSMAVLPLADMIMAFNTSNWLSGKLIVIVLVVASVFAWSVMVSKHRELKLAQDASERFLKAFRREKNPLALYVRRQAFEESPLYKVYEAGCSAVAGECGGGREEAPDNLLLADLHASRLQLNLLQIEVVRRAAERTVDDQALRLENRMGFLMTAVSASPLLGLLGTVWGVLDSFGEMALKGSANLSAVAPGISGALLTTVVALLVALPSAIGYNALSGQIRKLSVQMDHFAQELLAEIQRAMMSA